MFVLIHFISLQKSPHLLYTGITNTEIKQYIGIVALLINNRLLISTYLCCFMLLCFVMIYGGSGRNIESTLI